MSKRFAGLTPAQQRVFEQIAINQDGGHHPATLAALVRKEMIVEYDEVLAGHLPVKILRYFVPVAVHYEWAKWCSENWEEET